jgi:hypothetical protein
MTPRISAFDVLNVKNSSTKIDDTINAILIGAFMAKESIGI